MENLYEGKQEHIRSLNTPKIDFFKNIYAENIYKIHLEIPEFTAICPKTGLPDFGTIYITYIPSDYCLELKSLKEYIQFFRDIGIFHENFVNKLLDDIIRSVSPRYICIKVTYYPRGGIHTTVERSYLNSSDNLQNLGVSIG